MRKRLLLIIVLFGLTLLPSHKVYAFDSSNYRNRDLCATYEVVSMHSDGEMVTIDCFEDFGQARGNMMDRKSDDLVLMTKVNGETVIIDANVALVDLTVNPEMTYFYSNHELSGSSYTYMDTGSLYGGVDGVHLDTHYSNSWGTWVAKVQIANQVGWIPKWAYEIVPITWVKSSSYYTVTSTDIRHNNVSKIQNTYNGSNGRNIGPKPEMLKEGTYYSYDGHYFYTDLTTLIKDNKNDHHNNAVNKDNPYYNYYMYLSNHTKTAYSSINIDEYIRNNLGFWGNVYGNAASGGTSRLYGSGTFFYYAQEKYGVNAILSLSLSRNETGNGRSYLAVNKNNGFGLNAVDSNPINGASWYASFGSSILGYASKWITYGFAHPRDWRYYGPQFGDKWIGMNVKYASDAYWGEKMAANYYALDKAFGLQDYNYYQLGVVNGPTNAYLNPNTSSRLVYTYPEKEDAVVIVGEVTVGNELWYQLVSDINLDQNGNEITSGDYNWNSTVYVKASDVRKINTGKNGYISPKDMFQYEDSNYTYDLLIENTELKPRPAITTKAANYYFDSTLSSPIGKAVQSGRYVMVYTIAYQNNMPVAYLITSDYWHDQKHWVSADSIKFITLSYGKISVDVDGNQYSWVNYNKEDAAYSVISGLYTNTYVPILGVEEVNGVRWYKVPVNLTGNDNIYGYTLVSFPGVSFTETFVSTGDNKPIIQAKDQSLIEGTSFDPMKEVTANDAEDGDLTSKIEITENTVNKDKAGTYKVTYQVKDSSNLTATVTITVTVKENQAPVITASDKTIYVGDNFNPKEKVTAKDAEDGDITNKIQIKENTVDNTKPNTYQVIYEVVDSLGKKTTKEIKVTVKEIIVIDPEEQEFEELLEESNEGEFSLEELSWDINKKQFFMSGYCTIFNTNNTTDKEYQLILQNKSTEETTYLPLESWLEDTPYDLGNKDGYTLTISWFKGYLNLSTLENGDYNIYLFAKTKDHYTIQLVDNFFNQEIDKRKEDDSHGYNFKVLSKLKTKQMELNVRDHLITTSTSPTYRNMTNEFEEISFKENKLYIQGFSYNYKATYQDPLLITRKIIFENQKTYEQISMDVGSCKGPYELKTKDNLSKTFSWYEKELDLSQLPKGTYTIYVYTKTVDAEDYGELSDMFADLKEEKTMNGKKYTITYNSEKLNRVELIVE